MGEASDRVADGVAKLVAGRRRRRPFWPWAVLVLLAGGGAAGWYAFAGQQASDGIRFITEPARRGDLLVTVTATGTVEPTKQVTVSSELSGTIASVDVDYNDPVEVGTVLATLDAVKLNAQVTNSEAQLAVARGQLEQAEATAREAQSNFETQSAIDAKGIGAMRDLVTYRAAHERAQAAMSVARASLQLAEANLEADRADLAKTDLRSSIRGVVLDRAAEPGQIVASSLNAPTLFTLAEDLSRMQLLVDVDEADIGKVKAGDPATFTVDAFPERSFPAEITQVRFAPLTTNNVVTYKARLSVDNSDLALRPGMTATAVIRVTEMRDVLLIPNAALRYAPPRQAAARNTSNSGLASLIMPSRPPNSRDQPTATPGKLWVLRGGEPVHIAVQTGDSDGRYSVVLGGELQEGDQVITDQATGPAPAGAAQMAGVRGGQDAGQPRPTGEARTPGTAGEGPNAAPGAGNAAEGDHQRPRRDGARGEVGPGEGGPGEGVQGNRPPGGARGTETRPPAGAEGGQP